MNRPLRAAASAMVALPMLLAAACASWPEPPAYTSPYDPAERERLLLSDAPPPISRSCTVFVDELPRASKLVHSSRLLRALRATPAGRVLFSVGRPVGGGRPDVRILESDAAADTLAMRSFLEAALRKGAARGRRRIELRGGPEASVRIGYSESCAPSLVNQDAVADFLEESAPVGMNGKVVVRFRVGSDGKVLETRIYRSSGHEKLDRRAEGIASRLVFLPGLVDGEPVPMWAELPLEFRTVTEAE